MKILASNCILFAFLLLILKFKNVLKIKGNLHLASSFCIESWINIFHKGMICGPLF